MQYRVIERNYLDTFQEAMADAIAQGWIPQGGVSVCIAERKGRRDKVIIVKTFYQAMVKDNAHSAG